MKTADERKAPVVAVSLFLTNSTVYFIVLLSVVPALVIKDSPLLTTLGKGVWVEMSNLLSAVIRAEIPVLPPAALVVSLSIKVLSVVRGVVN